MTSTNDGKDVKSNLTSGPKGKTYYIDLYKSLEASLTSCGSLSERCEALARAWGRVHLLCSHSASTTHPHLIAWIQRHTAAALLQTEWQQPNNAEQRATLDRAIHGFLAEVAAAAQSRGSSLPWEASLVQRAEWLRRQSPDPWGHAVLRALLDPQGGTPSDVEVLEWLRQERGVVFVTRLRQLASSRCTDLALKLAQDVMGRVRAACRPQDNNPAPGKERAGVSPFGEALTADAGFTADIWELLTDMEFVLLHKADKTSVCIDLAKQAPLRSGYQLVERLRTRLETSPKEKKLWKNAKEVAILIAQVFVARCMVIPVCSGMVRLALYWTTRALVRLLPAARLPSVTAALAAPAASPQHLHTLAIATEAQCGEEMKPFVCELYVRAITAGMNELERLKLNKEKSTDARAMEQTLSMWFVQLGSVLSRSVRVMCECVLTAFSVHPSPAMYERLSTVPHLVTLKQEIQESTGPQSEFGSWATDSRSQTNLVKTSETLNLKQPHLQQANVLSTAILTEGETLGLSPELCQDLAVLLSGPRVKTLSWDMDREKLLENCRVYMERTSGGTRALTKELKYLNLDLAKFQHLPEEDEHEDDIYYGIEKGYEHLVELPEPEPEEIWADALSDDARTSSACSVEDKEQRRKNKKKHVSYTTDEDTDPLSLQPEHKKDRPKKERQGSNERPNSKERQSSKERHSSKERSHKHKSKSKDGHDASHSKDRRKRDMSKEKPKKEKRERKKKPKAPEELNLVYQPKPAPGSLANLIGLKVCTSTEETVIEQKTKDTKKRKQKMPKKKKSVDSDHDSHGKSTFSSLVSVDGAVESDVLFDGLFSIDDMKLKSPPKTILSPEISIKPATATNNNEFNFATSSTVTIKSPINSVSSHNTAQALPVSKETKVDNLNIKPCLDDASVQHGNPVCPDVRQRITKLLGFRKNKSQDNSPIRTASPYQSLTIARSTPTVKHEVSSQISKDAIAKIINNTKRDPVTVKNMSHLEFLKNYPQLQVMTGQKLTKKVEPTDVIIKTSTNTYSSAQSGSNGIHILSDQIYRPPKTGNLMMQAPQPKPVQEQIPPPGMQKIQGMKDFLTELQCISKVGNKPELTVKRAPKDAEHTHVISSSAPNVTINKSDPTGNMTSLTPPQCAKIFIPQKKVENAPNTFARRSYMHKNKQTDMKGKQNVEVSPLKPMTEQEAISNELERHIRQFRMLKAQELQSNGSTSVKVDRHIKSLLKPNILSKSTPPPLIIKASTANPVLSGILDSPEKQDIKPIFNENAQSKDHLPHKVPIPPTDGSFSLSLSKSDQNELFNLMQQRNKLNANISYSHASDQFLSSKIEQNPQYSRTAKPFSINQMGSSSVVQNNQLPVQVSTLNQNIGYVHNKLPTIPNATPSQQTVTEGSNTSRNIPQSNTMEQGPVAKKPSKPRPPKKKGKQLEPDKLQQDLQNVMSALLAQKTPSRGHNALDMTMKSEQETKSILRQQRIHKVKPEVQKVTEDGKVQLKQTDTQSVPSSLTVTPSDMKPELRDDLTKLLPGTDIKKQPRKRQPRTTKSKSKPDVPSLLDGQKNNPIILKQPQPASLSQPTSPTILSQFEAHNKMPSLPQNQGTSEEYDLLNDLIDMDLLREIDELSSDEDTRKTAIPNQKAAEEKCLAFQGDIITTTIQKSLQSPPTLSTSPHTSNSSLPKKLQSSPAQKPKKSAYPKVAYTMPLKYQSQNKYLGMRVKHPHEDRHLLKKDVSKDLSETARDKKSGSAVDKNVTPIQQSISQCNITTNIVNSTVNSTSTPNIMISSVPVQNVVLLSPNTIPIQSVLQFQDTQIFSPNIPNIDQNQYLLHTPNLAVYQPTPTISHVIVGNAATSQVSNTYPIQVSTSQSHNQYFVDKTIENNSVNNITQFTNINVVNNKIIDAANQPANTSVHNEPIIPAKRRITVEGKIKRTEFDVDSFLITSDNKKVFPELQETNDDDNARREQLTCDIKIPKNNVITNEIMQKKEPEKLCKTVKLKPDSPPTQNKNTETIKENNIEGNTTKPIFNAKRIQSMPNTEQQTIEKSQLDSSKENQSTDVKTRRIILRSSNKIEDKCTKEKMTPKSKWLEIKETNTTDKCAKKRIRTKTERTPTPTRVSKRILDKKVEVDINPLDDTLKTNVNVESGKGFKNTEIVPLFDIESELLGSKISKIVEPAAKNSEITSPVTNLNIDDILTAEDIEETLENIEEYMKDMIEQVDKKTNVNSEITSDKVDKISSKIVVVKETKPVEQVIPFTIKEVSTNQNNITVENKYTNIEDNNLVEKEKCKSVIEKDIPAVTKYNPVVLKNKPVVKEDKPAVEKETPNNDEDVKIKEELPAIDFEIPKTETVPTTETDIPQIEKVLPDTERVTTIQPHEEMVSEKALATDISVPVMDSRSFQSEHVPEKLSVEDKIPVTKGASVVNFKSEFINAPKVEDTDSTNIDDSKIQISDTTIIPGHTKHNVTLSAKVPTEATKKFSTNIDNKMEKTDTNSKISHTKATMPSTSILNIPTDKPHLKESAKPIDTTSADSVVPRPTPETNSSFAKFDEMRSKIKIEQVKSRPAKDGQRARKTVRIKLPNGKSFKVTVTGTLDLNFDSLLSDPQIKSIMSSNWTECKIYNLNVKHTHTSGDLLQVIDAEEINENDEATKKVLETIDLISDDDFDEPKNEYLNKFITEFGVYKVTNSVLENIKSHQSKLNQKCSIKLIKHPDSFFQKHEIIKQKENEENVQELIEISESDHEYDLQCNEKINQIEMKEEITLPKQDIPIVSDTIKDIPERTKIYEILEKQLESLNKPTSVAAPDVIEIDDSSCDEIDSTKPTDLLLPPEIVLKIPETPKTVVPEEKIFELKNLLLNDLGVLDDVPTVNLDNIPTVDLDDEPTVNADNIPTVDLDDEPTVNANNIPIVELNEEPTVHAENIPSVELDEEPIVDADNIKTVELDEESTVQLKKIATDDLNITETVNATPDSIPVFDLDKLSNKDIQGTLSDNIQEITIAGAVVNKLCKECFVQLLKCDDLVEKCKMVKKCAVKLVKCDHLVTKTSDVSDDELTIDLQSPTSTKEGFRSASPSILFDYPSILTETDVELSLLTSESDSNLEEYDGRTSPVIEVFEVIAKLHELIQKKEVQTKENKIYLIKCEAEWFATKRPIRLTERCDQEINLKQNSFKNNLSLISTVLKFFENIDILDHLKPLRSVPEMEIKSVLKEKILNSPRDLKRKRDQCEKICVVPKLSKLALDSTIHSIKTSKAEFTILYPDPLSLISPAIDSADEDIIQNIQVDSMKIMEMTRDISKEVCPMLGLDNFAIISRSTPTFENEITDDQNSLRRLSPDNDINQDELEKKDTTQTFEEKLKEGVQYEQKHFDHQSSDSPLQIKTDLPNMNYTIHRRNTSLANSTAVIVSNTESSSGNQLILQDNQILSYSEDSESGKVTENNTKDLESTEISSTEHVKEIQLSTYNSCEASHVQIEVDPIIKLLNEINANEPSNDSNVSSKSKATCAKEEIKIKTDSDNECIPQSVTDEDMDTKDNSSTVEFYDAMDIDEPYFDAVDENKTEENNTKECTKVGETSVVLAEPEKATIEGKETPEMECLNKIQVEGTETTNEFEPHLNNSNINSVNLGVIVKEKTTTTDQDEMPSNFDVEETTENFTERAKVISVHSTYSDEIGAEKPEESTLCYDFVTSESEVTTVDNSSLESISTDYKKHQSYEKIESDVEISNNKITTAGISDHTVPEWKPSHVNTDVNCTEELIAENTSTCDEMNMNEDHSVHDIDVSQSNYKTLENQENAIEHQECNWNISKNNDNDGSLLKTIREEENRNPNSIELVEIALTNKLSHKTEEIINVKMEDDESRDNDKEVINSALEKTVHYEKVLDIIDVFQTAEASTYRAHESSNTVEENIVSDGNIMQNTVHEEERESTSNSDYVEAAVVVETAITVPENIENAEELEATDASTLNIPEIHNQNEILTKDIGDLIAIETTQNSELEKTVHYEKVPDIIDVFQTAEASTYRANESSNTVEENIVSDGNIMQNTVHEEERASTSNSDYVEAAVVVETAIIVPENIENSEVLEATDASTSNIPVIHNQNEILTKDIGDLIAIETTQNSESNEEIRRKELEIDTCNVLRSFEDNVSETQSVLTSDSTNETPKDYYEIIQIISEKEEDEEMTIMVPQVGSTDSPDVIESNRPHTTTPMKVEVSVHIENLKSPTSFLTEEKDNVSSESSMESDTENISIYTSEKLKLKKPKRTYKIKSLKRKKDMKEIRVPENKKYRKGKNIDCSKIRRGVDKSSYGKEYHRLIEYIDSVEFSFARPFHKEWVDVDRYIENWPIVGPVPIIVNTDDNSESDIKLFIDEEIKPPNNPLDQSLVEELSADCQDSQYSSTEETETNFHMGFGEGSDRVIQNLKEEGDISNISAATLSDVKHTQPLPSEDSRTKTQSSFQKDQVDQLKRYVSYIQLKEKVRSYFEKIKDELDTNSKDNKIVPTNKEDVRRILKNVPGLYGTEFMEPPPLVPIIQVVQVGQLPVSAAAQNPVTCDPRVTQVSDASPSQCSVGNSPQSDNQSNIKAEYTELTTADLSLPLVQEMTPHEQQMAMIEQMKAENTNPEELVIPKSEEIKEDREKPEITYDNSLSETNQSMEYSYDSNANDAISLSSQMTPDLFTTTPQNEPEPEDYMHVPKQENGAPEKIDQIAHAMSAAGIETTPETTVPNTRAQQLVNLLSQKVLRQIPVSTAQTSTNNYSKTSINAMALQQALASILPPPLNQTSSGEGQQTQNTNVGPQVLHIVQGKNANGNQITLVDNSQPSVINSNATQVLHIVQNKATGANANGNQTGQGNSFSGLSLVDAGLQQGGNQLLHIVNTGNQKGGNAGQLLKRVNLLTNLANVQGGNEQKMVQFVCKSADGKSIHLNAPHQRSMVLRLQPIETPNVQQQPATPNKTADQPDLSPTQNAANALTGKESASEIKSRSVYEENYAKFIQNSSTKPAASTEKSTSLPKFNQAFGKPVFQEGAEKQNDMNNAHLNQVHNSEGSEQQTTSINLEHINQIHSPPLLLRKTTTPTSQTQSNLVQQIKQTIAPMNIQTMHGGVIYTRQIPVNIGGGQTINLITVPSTELVDENGQKQQTNEMEPSIIKIVPQTQTNTEGSEDNAHMNVSNENPPTPQPQPVLTQMRIKLPMLSKTPQMPGARVVRPSFFQIQRNVIGGANQPVYQQLVLTAAPPLGQQTIRLPTQTQTRPVKVPQESPATSESQLSSSTLEQLREFDMVLEQVKERSSVPPNASSSTYTKLHTSSTDTTDSGVSVPTSTSTTSPEQPTTQQVLYSIGNTLTTTTMNVAYVSRKSTTNTPATSSYVRSPDSSGIADSPSSSHVPTTVSEAPERTESHQPKAAKIGSKSCKSRPSKPSSSHTPSALKLNHITPKTSTQKPLEDEQTTQRILYILAEYKEQVENSPDKDKPAPRRRSNPPISGSGSSKRKKSGGRRPGCTRDHSPIDDGCRTMGSEDSSCGTSQGDCNESCSIDALSPQESPRKIVRKLTFEQESPPAAPPTPRPQAPRNVIVADGQTITVARSATGKPTTAVLMPANYILPVSMVKGGQQIAIVTNRGPKLLTVGGATGEAGAANALLLQRLIGPAGLKPGLLARPGVRHVRLPTAALHNLQAFNIATTVQPPDSTASSASAPTPPELADTRATSSPWNTDSATEVKPERGSSPETSEPWNLATSDPPDYTYEEPVTSRRDAADRTVLDAIPDRYSPDMEAQRIFDKMFDVDGKKCYDDSPRVGHYDIDPSHSDCEDKPYQVVKKDGSHGYHRVAHISTAALRHKYAILEHELRLQKSLSEECSDLGVDSPSASELFPEAELLFAASPQHDAPHDHPHTHAHANQPSLLSQHSIPQPDLDDQTATDQLLPARDLETTDDGANLEQSLAESLGGGGLALQLDHEEFARHHPNTTFHSEPNDQVQPFSTISSGLKGRHITSTIFHSSGAPATVLMTAPAQTVISHRAGQPSGHNNNVKYADIDHMINSLPSHANQDINLSSVLVKDDGLTRFDSILTDNRELHLSNNASAIVHGHATQVIRRVRYDGTEQDRDRFLLEENDALIAGDDAKMNTAEDSSRDAMLEDCDDESSPERHAELFWESNSASERSESRRPLDFSSDSDKCCNDETNSTDSSGVGTHLRLDSVIKEARGGERRGSMDGSSADDTAHPPLRTYPPKRSFHNDYVERSLSGKTRAGERSPDSPEVRRRASGRGVVKRGCHCCNGSPPRPKKPRQRKPTLDFTHTN